MRWLVSGAVPEGVAGLVVAAGDTGKSYLLLELGMRIAWGPQLIERPIFGGLVQAQGAVVFLTAEDSRACVHRRLKALDADGARQAKGRFPLIVVPLSDTGGPFPIVVQGRGAISVTPQYEALRQQLGAMPDLRLVVLDPLQTFVLADVNADPLAAAFVMARLNLLAAETGATVLAAHHVRKDKEPPKNAQEARHLIRGSSALVDQSRVAIVLWTPEDRRCRQVCKQMGAEYAPNAVVHGAVVKSNDGASRKEWVLLRATTGLLRDVTADLAGRSTGKDKLRELLVGAIKAAAAEGRPYTKTGVNGLYVRRAQLGEELSPLSRTRLEEMAQELEGVGRIVTALAIGTTVKWLDVPDGPFAKGKGEFAPGAGTGKAGRKPC
jgi:hypothetical protein